MPQRPLVGGVDVFRNREGEWIFMNEVELLSPPPWSFSRGWMINANLASPNKRPRGDFILSDFALFGQSIMRPSIVWSHVNEPSGLLRKSLSAGAVSGMLLAFAIHRHAIDAHSCKAPRMQKLRHRVSPETAENAAIKIKMNVNKHEVRNECFRESASTSCCWPLTSGTSLLRALSHESLLCAV